MNKSNQILMGIIILLIGMLGLLHSFVKLDYFSLSVTIVGFAFLLLYRTKRKSWSLILGSYITYIGLCKLLGALGFSSVLTLIVSGMFFIVPGLVFLVLFFDKNKRGLLFPASLLFWFGIYVVVSGIFKSNGLGQFNSSLFFVSMGIAFLTISYFGRFFINKYVKYIGILLLVFGFIRVLGFSLQPLVFSFSTVVVPLIVIFASIVIILKALKK